MSGLITSGAALFFFPLAGAFVYEAFRFLVANFEVYGRGAVAYGFAAYFVLFVAISRRKINFLEVLEHEIIHATIALVFFWMDIKELKAAPEGGQTAFYEEPNAIIRMAPYCIPITTIPLVAIRFFVSSPVTIATIDFLIGFTFAFHFLALRHEFSFSQSDFITTGRLFSAVIVSLANSFLVVFLVCVFSGRYSDIPGYCDASIVRAREFYRITYGILGTLLERFVL